MNDLIFDYTDRRKMVYTGNSRDDILDLFYCRRADILDFMTMKTYCSTGLYGYSYCACLPARCNKGRSSENGALRDTQDTGDFSIIRMESV